MVLVDEGVPALKGADFALVVIDADDAVTHLSEADGGHQADVTGTDYGNFDVCTHIEEERTPWSRWNDSGAPARSALLRHPTMTVYLMRGAEVIGEPDSG